MAEHGYPLSEIKRQLCLAYGFDLSDINTLEELSTPSILEQNQKMLETELANLEEKHKKSMTQAIAAQRQSIFEQDAKRRETLQFISAIGFDLLPQHFTDQIITEIR